MDYTIFVTHALKTFCPVWNSHTPAGRQVKMACNVPHLCQFILIQGSFKIFPIHLLKKKCLFAALDIGYIIRFYKTL